MSNFRKGTDEEKTVRMPEPHLLFWGDYYTRELPMIEFLAFTKNDVVTSKLSFYYEPFPISVDCTLTLAEKPTAIDVYNEFKAVFAPKSGGSWSDLRSYKHGGRLWCKWEMRKSMFQELEGEVKSHFGDEWGKIFSKINEMIKKQRESYEKETGTKLPYP